MTVIAKRQLSGLFLLVLFVVTGVVLANDPVKLSRESTDDWATSRGTLELAFNLDLLSSLGIRLVEAGTDTVVESGVVQLPIEASDALFMHVRAGESIQRFTGGHWVVRGGFDLLRGEQRHAFSGLSLRPGVGSMNVLDLYTGQGRHGFFIDHIHTHVDVEKSTLRMFNMDLRISSSLAQEIGDPRLAGLALAIGRTQSELQIPASSALGPELDGPEGLSCANRPLWPSETAPADVALIAIGFVQQMRRNASTGEVVIAPSATLKNVGVADVPWYRQFTPPRPPYDNDQHPYLAWGLFRRHQGRIQQIGRSGLKHAFLTINQNCTIDCGGGGSILWPGCEDVYGTNNNDDAFHMGPMEEIDPFRGLWDSCNSFFDPQCTGNQTQFAGPPGGFCFSDPNHPNCFLNRMVVDEAELQIASFPGASYSFQAWYVVRDDVDIFNTMGYRPVQPQFSDSLWLFSLGAFVNGPAVDAFIAPGPGTDWQRNTPVVTSEGHLRVLINVIDNNDGTYRYEYAIMNLDLGAGIESLQVPAAASASISNLGFGLPAGVFGAPWTGATNAEGVTWQAPTAADRQPWMSLYNFHFVSDRPPMPAQLSLAVNGVGEVKVDSLAPAMLDLIFADGFEEP